MRRHLPLPMSHYIISTNEPSHPSTNELRHHFYFLMSHNIPLPTGHQLLSSIEPLYHLTIEQHIPLSTSHLFHPPPTNEPPSPPVNEQPHPPTNELSHPAINVRLTISHIPLTNEPLRPQAGESPYTTINELPHILFFYNVFRLPTITPPTPVRASQAR
jgi:hypothetical protein